MKLNSTRVALLSCQKYDTALLADTVDRVMAALDHGHRLYSCKVLLKPNLITASYGPLPCTQAAFVLAVARWLIDQGSKVSIGDSPAFGTATASLQRLGMYKELTSLGVQVTDFKMHRTVQLAGGARAGVASDALDCDLLFNLPRVKAHAQTRVTLAVKNCFGSLVGLRKPWWHMAYGGENGTFADRLVQLLDVLADSVTLVDGITAMAKTGPIHGEPYPLGIVAASTNPVAVDRAVHEVIGLAPEQSPLMTACGKHGLAGADLAELDFPLMHPGEIKVDDFRVPETLNPVRFSLRRFLRSTLKRVFLNSQTRQ